MWFLGLSALCGNVFTLFWRAKAKTKSHTQTVQAMLIANLAISDLLMGVYMIILACADLYFGDSYFVYSDAWRTGRVCRLTGFLSLLSSEASVLLLTLISIDRFCSVIFPFSKARLNPKSAKIILGFIWFITFILSLVPVLLAGPDSDFYDLSDVCIGLPLITRPAGYTFESSGPASERKTFKLPIPDKSKPAWYFSIAIFLGLNLFCFLTILVCYVAVFIGLKISASRVKRKGSKDEELKLAVKMAIIVGTDFLCWVPVILMGILSQTGAIEIPLVMYTWSVVFILPINSSLNPYLYTIASIVADRRNKTAPLGVGSRNTGSTGVSGRARGNVHSTVRNAETEA